MARIRLVEGIVTGLWLGGAKKAPGTVGSIGAVIFWYGLSMGYDSLFFRIGEILFITLIGWIATDRYLKGEALGDHADPSEVVIDEWSGMLIALLLVPNNSIWQIVAAFALFRLYDISKLWPICLFEKLPGATGVMLDDIVAGFFALASLVAIRSLLAILLYP